MIGHRGPPNPRPEPLPRPKPSPKPKIINGHICHLCSIQEPWTRIACENHPNNKPVTQRELDEKLDLINKKLDELNDLLRRN